MPTAPPGRLIDIGGYRLHAQMQGSGDPAVVMDSGLTANSLLFARVTPQVAEFTTAVAFDRAGYPWSDPAPTGTPRTSCQIVEELRTLLQRLELQPPYLLVGLSFGAINMLTYARHYPHEVAGIVLADPSHPEQWTRVPFVPGPKGTVSSLKLLRRLAQWGIFRRFGRTMKGLLTVNPDALPPQSAAAYVEQIGDTAIYDISIAEAELSAQSFAGANLPPGGLGDLPLIVLTADYWTQGFPRRMKQAMLALREEMVHYSSRGEHRIVANSSHALPVDQPGAVVDAIREMVEQLRRG